MNSKQRKGAQADVLPHLVVDIEPYTSHSVITVVLSTRGGRERVDHRLARWHIRLTRSDLAGHSTTDVLLTTLGMVMRRLESGASDPADWVAKHVTPQAVGPGAPLGATGGTVTQDCLPGMPTALGTLGGIDTV